MVKEKLPPLLNKDDEFNADDLDLAYTEYPDKTVETEELESPFLNEGFSDGLQDDFNDTIDLEGVDDIIEEKNAVTPELEESVIEYEGKPDSILKGASASNLTIGIIKYCRDHKIAGIGDFLSKNWGKILGGIGAAVGGIGAGYGISSLINMDENEFAEGLRNIGVSEANINTLRNKAKSMGDDFKGLYDNIFDKYHELLSSTNEFDAKNQINRELSAPDTMDMPGGMSTGFDSGMGRGIGGGGINAGPIDMAKAVETQGLSGEITPEQLIKLLQMSGQDVSGLR